MNDFLLRTSSETAFNQTLEQIGLMVSVDDGKGNISMIPVASVTLDRIGPINADSRYHANVRADLTPTQIAALPTFTPLPVTPYRVFFD